MWLRKFGVLSAAVLFTNGIAFGQDAVTASGGGIGAPAYDWLSPARIAWIPTNFSWAELPVKIFVHEAGGYNSNIYNLSPYQISQGTFLPKGLVNADYFMRTDFGASTKIDIESQQIFVDLVQSTTNYRHDIVDDLHNHSFDGGVNWRAGSHCDGKLIATDSVAQAVQEEAVGPGIDILTTRSFNESGQCHFYQNINVILNADALSTRHTLPTAIPLDNNTTYVQAGLQYQWPSLDSLEPLVKYTNTNYTNRPVSLTQGLVPEYVHLINYSLSYNYQSSEVIGFSLMGGFTQSLDLISPTGNTTNGKLQPVYSIALNYHPSSKWSLTLNSSRTVTPPNSLLTTSSTQTNTAQAATLSYALTPKVSLSASLSLSTSSAPGLTASGRNGFGFYGPSTVFAVVLGASYSITPFTSLVFSLNQTKRETNATSATNGNGNINTSLVTIGLDYRPH